MVVRRVIRAIRKRLGGVREISDEFVDWLYFANPGMLHRGNLYCFDLALSHLPSDAAVLEIGSFCGLSTNVITHYLRRHGRNNPFFGCDPWQFEGSVRGGTLGESTIRHEEYRGFVRESFLRNVSFFSSGRLPHTVEMDSAEFFRAWAAGRTIVDVFGRRVQLGGPLAFAFIDGNHSYAAVRHDFEACDRSLQDGGFVLFDDSADDSGFDVARVVREVLSEGRYRLMARNPNHLLQKALLSPRHGRDEPVGAVG